jgi:hypothetical protein
LARKRAGAQDDPSPGIDRLTFRQRLFVSYYLGESNGNATDAARRAGYADPNSQGPRLSVNVSIRAAIDAKLEGPALAADEVLARLSEVASVDMDDFVRITARGGTLDLKRARERGKTHLIKSLRPTKYGLAIELHDSQAALEKLGRYHGLFGPAKGPASGDDDDGDGEREELDRQITGIVAAGDPAASPGGIVPPPDPPVSP